MSYIAEKLKREVRQRATDRSEYCLLHERYAMKSHEVDHIYAEKHDGETVTTNLCLSCIDCNRFKGSDLCSYDIITGNMTALYHPRQLAWIDHFQLTGSLIQPITPTGRVTVRLLQINDPERAAERETLIQLGR